MSKVMQTENVWDYPRPPVWQYVGLPIRIVFDGTTIAETELALRVLETSHPPVYYLPPAAFAAGTLKLAGGSSFCEWKGSAKYWDICHLASRAPGAAWSYPSPHAPFAELRDHVAVYAHLMDACFVGDEQVTPQPGGFYGGWITTNLVGPFKGIPGSKGW